MNNTVNTGNKKEDVKIKNTGDTDAYIRVALVVNWMNDKGNVWGTKPVEGTDYNMTLDLANGWSKGSVGYYYYNTKVAKDQLTPILIDEANVLKAGPVGTDGTQYYLSIEIVAEAIQADGIAAEYGAQEAWQRAAKAN
ncbi:MAG: hypothetical protein IIX77_01445 [Oscillospiraceae bacterium]|nr:hypothetical protein [Oscillospiraceae bacterium]